MAEIILKFDMDTGETHVETTGFTGSSCRKASEFLEKTLGQTSDFQRKSEWFTTNMVLNHGNINTNLCG